MRVIRERDLDFVDGLTRTTRRRLIAAGKYPKPIKLSDYMIGWLDTDVQAFIAERARLSGRTDIQPAPAT